MADVKVLNQNGEVVENAKLNDAVWAIEPNDQAMFDAVLVYRSNLRQATAKTKIRSEVRGGGRKPWRQKGTGRARQGSIRAPQWRGGGTVFGPTGNQNYKIKMNKQVRSLALKSALSVKAAAGAVTVIDKLELNSFRTKDFIEILSKLNANGKVLVVGNLESINDEAVVSSYNVQGVCIVDSKGFNTYDVLNCDTLVVTQSAVEDIEEALING